MPLKLPIYLDYHATTPVDSKVLEVMLPYFSEKFGNPASALHSFGWKAEAAVKKAQEQVATLIHASNAKEIVWTSGTTESINLALKGVCASYASKGNHLITWKTEHRSVLETMKSLERQGLQVTYLSVNEKGLIDLGELKSTITDKTILISLLGAHNEIGTIQPVAEVGRIAKKKGVLFHVDGAQMCGKIPVDVQKMGIDLFSMSAHKVYGPKGIGALYVRSRRPHVRLKPLIDGGGNSLRAGTLPTQSIVGMGEAFELAGRLLPEEAKQLERLRTHLWEELKKNLDHIFLNGDLDERLPGNLNVSFMGVKSEALIGELGDIAISSGSACSSSSTEASYVIQALGLGRDRGVSSIRFGLGRYTTEAEIDFVIKNILAAVNNLRSSKASSSS